MSPFSRLACSHGSTISQCAGSLKSFASVEQYLQIVETMGFCKYFGTFLEVRFEGIVRTYHFQLNGSGLLIFRQYDVPPTLMRTLLENFSAFISQQSSCYRLIHMRSLVSRNTPIATIITSKHLFLTPNSRHAAAFEQSEILHPHRYVHRYHSRARDNTNPRILSKRLGNRYHFQRGYTSMV